MWGKEGGTGTWETAWSREEGWESMLVPDCHGTSPLDDCDIWQEKPALVIRELNVHLTQV